MRKPHGKVQKLHFFQWIVKLIEKSVTFEKLNQILCESLFIEITSFSLAQFIFGRSRTNWRWSCSGRPSIYMICENINIVFLQERLLTKCFTKMSLKDLEVVLERIGKQKLQWDRTLQDTTSISEYFTSKGMPVVPQPPYSCHLSPYGFSLWKCFKKTLFWGCGET